MSLRTTANGSSFRPSFKLLLLCLMRALTGECCTGSITIRPYTEPGPASVICQPPLEQRQHRPPEERRHHGAVSPSPSAVKVQTYPRRCSGRCSGRAAWEGTSAYDDFELRAFLTHRTISLSAVISPLIAGKGTPDCRKRHSAHNVHPSYKLAILGGDRSTFQQSHAPEAP
jgi:hypothetical protein